MLGFIITGCSNSRRVNEVPSREDAYKDRPSANIQKRYADVLGVSPQNITNKTLYAFIDKWMNTSYQYGGQSSKGVDCSGFTQLLFDAVYNKKIPRTSGSQYMAVKGESKKNLTEGDLVFFTTVKGQKISHVGVYLQNNKFVNATTSKGVIISDMTMKYWDERYVGGGSIK